MSSPKPRQLRKRLRKAETKLAKATAERDRAQARVEALAIIADEIRAQLEESEKATQEGPRRADRKSTTHSKSPADTASA